MNPRLIPAAVMALAALAQPAAAQARADSAASPLRPRTTYEDLQMFSQVLNQIRVNHPDSVDTHAMFMAAIEGMVHAADPHSYVVQAARLSPERQRDLEAGRLVPVPLDFSFFGGSPVVAAVAPGSDAARLDILPGDELVAVQGRPVQAQSATELDVMLAGPRNSTVALTFERRRVDGTLAHLERAVKRERVADETAVPAAFLLDPHTGYVRVTSFGNDKVADDLHAALARLETQGMTRLVLDLRDNGGGLVDEAAKVAGEFLPEGQVVYSSEGRKAEMRETVKVKRSFWRRERRYPIVLMQNDGTASASELVAGALQDHDRALIVGRASFGKSLIMRGFPLTDGSMIELVVGHMKTPCGRVIQRQYRGVERRDYYRMAAAARDTAGRPSCKTDGGRTVYGGGGIYPDVVFAERPGYPVWLARLLEEAVPLRWAGGYLTANPAAFTTPEALAAHPELPAAALADFRAFAQTNAVTVPTGADADARLQHTLVRTLARLKWGSAGVYRVEAAIDPDVAEAVKQFDRAAQILGAQP
ncbi:MAG TPA: S41 family peptidase [Longimicrobiaceae bacterium]|nr:S41 family peptidase [Longimicrobiaceae bacterium]